MFHYLSRGYSVFYRSQYKIQAYRIQISYGYPPAHNCGIALSFCKERLSEFRILGIPKGGDEKIPSL